MNNPELVGYTRRLRRYSLREYSSQNYGLIQGFKVPTKQSVQHML